MGRRLRDLEFGRGFSNGEVRFLGRKKLKQRKGFEHGLRAQHRFRLLPVFGNARHAEAFGILESDPLRLFVFGIEMDGSIDPTPADHHVIGERCDRAVAVMIDMPFQVEHRACELELNSVRVSEVERFVE